MFWQYWWLWAAVGGVILAALRVRKRFRYFEERGLPYLGGVFPLGTPALWKAFLGLQQPGLIHDRLYRRLEGHRLAGVFLGLVPSLIVRDPELVNRVLIKDFSHFHDRGIRVDEKVNPLDGHLFFLSGEKWRILRNKLSPTFTSSKLKWMFSQMEVCSGLLLRHLERETPKGDLEIRDVLGRFTTDVIGSCAFGYKPESIENPHSMFRIMGTKIFHPSLYFFFVGAFRFLFPDLFISMKLKTVPEDVNDFFGKVFRETVEQRRRSGENRNDFVQLLLQLKEKGRIEVDPRDLEEDMDHHLAEHPPTEEKIELTDDLLNAQAFVFFVAGFETSATSMSFTMYLLAKHPEAQEKARREVREVKRKFGGFTYDALKELHYLESCFNEAVRLYPPIPALSRECTRTLVMEDGTTLEKGLNLLIPVIGIHHDPDIYPEPDKFRPERFSEGQGSAPGTFLPFGDGPRICIGKRFAMVEIKLCLAVLLDGFRFALSPRTEEPLRLNPRSFVMQADSGIWLRFRSLREDH